MFSRIFEIVENLFFLIVRKIIEFEKCALTKYNIRKFQNFVFCHARIKRLGASHNKRNREQKIRIFQPIRNHVLWNTQFLIG